MPYGGKMKTYSFVGKFILIATLIIFAHSHVSDAAEIDDIKQAIKDKHAKWLADTNKIHKLTKEQRKRRAGLTMPDLSSAVGSGLSANATGQTNTSNLLTAPSGGFDWRSTGGTNYITPIKDQGDCGSCWAFASTAALESYTLIHGSYLNDLNLSEQILLSCSGAGTCNGGYINGAADFIELTGVGNDSLAPYKAIDQACSAIDPVWKATADKIVGWKWITYGAGDVAALKNAVLTYGPVVVSMRVYDDFFAYQSGIYSYTGGGYAGGHAVTVVGYSDDQSVPGGGYFIVKNSWGTGWGEPFGTDSGGYFRIAYGETATVVKFAANTIAYDTVLPTSCTYSIGSQNSVAPSYAGYGDFDIITSLAACKWTLKTDAPWLFLLNTSFNGTTLVTYMVPTNSGAGRTATVTMYDQNGNRVGATTLNQPAVSTPFVPPSAQLTVASAVNSLTIPLKYIPLPGSSPLSGRKVTSTPATPTTWDTTSPTGFTVAAPGTYTLYAWAQDMGGIVSKPTAYTVIVDKSVPVITRFSVSAGPNGTVLINELTATDNGAIGGYQVTTTPTVPTTWNATPPASLSTATSGTITVYAWVKDSAGNVSAPTSVTVTVDAAVPSLTSFVVPTTVYDLNIPITSFKATDNMGVTGYLITTTSTRPAAADARWTAAAPTVFTVPATGRYTLYGWAKDAAGNVSYSWLAGVTVNVPRPIVGSVAFGTPYAVYGTGSVLPTTVVPTTVTASGTVPAVAAYISTSAVIPPATAPGWSALSATVTYPAGSSSGTKQVYVWLKDAGGTLSAMYTGTVTIDASPPVVTGLTVPASYNSLVVPIMLCTATDDVGVAGYKITQSTTRPAAADAGWTATPPTSYTVASTGLQQLFGWAKDATGNVSVSGKQALVSVTNTKPMVIGFTLGLQPTTYSISISKFTSNGATGSGYYLITETSTTPSATNTAWSAAPPASYSFPFGTSGSKTLYAWVKDTSGTISPSLSATCVLDSQAPTVSGFVTPSIAPTTTVPITSITAKDNIGVTGYLITQNFTKPSITDPGWTSTVPASFTVAGNSFQLMYAWARDAAGNISSTWSATTYVDNTPPTMLPLFVSSTAKGTTVAVQLMSAIDDWSGVKAYLITESAAAPLATDPRWSATAPTSYTTTSLGTKTLYGWAVDKMGNVAVKPSSSVVKFQ